MSDAVRWKACRGSSTHSDTLLCVNKPAFQCLLSHFKVLWHCVLPPLPLWSGSEVYVSVWLHSAQAVEEVQFVQLRFCLCLNVWTWTVHLLRPYVWSSSRRALDWTSSQFLAPEGVSWRWTKAAVLSVVRAQTLSSSTDWTSSSFRRSSLIRCVSKCRGTPSRTITTVSRMMRNVVQMTRTENIYVQMGSASLYSGLNRTM